MDNTSTPQSTGSVTTTSTPIVIPPIPAPTAAQPIVPVINSPQPVPQAPTTNLNLATPGQRFLAQLIDGFILGAFSFLIMIPFALLSATIDGGSSGAPASFIGMISQFIVLIGYTVYPIYFIGKKGATPGKSIMKIKVVKLNTVEPLNFVDALLRETVGKILSSSILAIGYFAILWDKNRQAWHDKIAGTIVVKTN